MDKIHYLFNNVRMEILPIGENVALEPLEEASIRLLNDYLRGKYRQSSKALPSALKVQIGQELKEGRDMGEGEVHVTDLDSTSERVEYIEGIDGTAIIHIPEYHTVIVELNDKTALVTDELLTCHGYGMKMEDTQSGTSVVSLVHFNEMNGLERLKEFLDKRTNGLVARQIAYSLPRDIASNEIQRTRKMLSGRVPPVEEVTRPDTHSYMRMAGMIITKTGGVFLEDRAMANSLTPVYAPKLRWDWK